MNKMLRVLIGLALLVSGGSGCTANALARRTVNQSQSVTSLRYQSALRTLAVVAANRSEMPCYALLTNGITTVTDVGTVNPVSNWGTTTAGAELFASEVVGLSGSRSPSMSWTFDPIADFTQLKAVRAACRWVLDGQNRDCLDIYDDGILADPETACSSSEPHFGVSSRLCLLPDCWLRVGAACDVPRCACYKEHCGDTWVWVTSEGLQGLAGFTLVLQDIATLNVTPGDTSVPSQYRPPILVTLWTTQNTLPTKFYSVSIDPKTGNPSAEFKINPAETLDPTVDNIQPSSTIRISVGDTVTWTNNCKGTEKITGTAQAKGTQSLFSLTIEPGQKKVHLFSADDYKKAGGLPGNHVFVTVNSATSGASTHIQLDDPGLYKNAYSPTVITRSDRVIPPCSNFKNDIEQKLQTGLKGLQDQPVTIPWSDWVTNTTAYPGQRTAAKPGAPQQAALPQRRATPFSTNVYNNRLLMSPVLDQLDYSKATSSDSESSAH